MEHFFSEFTLLFIQIFLIGHVTKKTYFFILFSNLIPYHKHFFIDIKSVLNIKKTTIKILFMGDILAGNSKRNFI
jgi:hypothetical protein